MTVLQWKMYKGNLRQTLAMVILAPANISADDSNANNVWKKNKKLSLILAYFRLQGDPNGLN